MKFSSLLALSALVGRKLVKGPETWKDQVLKAVVFKNEVMDRDGMVRSYLRDEVKAELEGIDDDEDIGGASPPPLPDRGLPGQGFWANFWHAYHRKR